MKLQLMRFLSVQETPLSLDLTYNFDVIDAGHGPGTSRESNLELRRKLEMEKTAKLLIINKVQQDAVTLFE
jgi:hypothetical protein